MMVAPKTQAVGSHVSPSAVSRWAERGARLERDGGRMGGMSRTRTAHDGHDPTARIVVQLSRLHLGRRLLAWAAV